MPGAAQPSESKRALLNKYLRGELPQSVLPLASTPPQSYAQKASSARERVVAVQHGTAQPPFFFLHGQWDGGMFSFPLARDMGTEQPVYAVDPYTFHGLRTLPSLEEVASAHIRSIRAIQPQGPYLLGGYCNGALVAYEIARQLDTEGQTVSFLAMIDPMAPSDPRLLRRVTKRISDGVRWFRDYVYAGALATMAVSHIGAMLHTPEDVQVDHLLRALWLYKHVRETCRSLRYPRYKPPQPFVPFDLSGGAEHNKKRLSVWRAGSFSRDLFPAVEALRQNYEGLFIWLASKYVSRGYRGKLTFVWSSSEPMSSYRRAAWREVANGMDAVEYVIPGSHATLRDQDVRLLAQRLRLCIDEALGTMPTPTRETSTTSRTKGRSL